MGIVVDLLCPCTHSLARWFPEGTFPAPGTPSTLPWHDPTTALIRISLTCYPVTLLALLLAAKSWLVRARARRLQRLAQVAGSMAAVLDVSAPPPATIWETPAAQQSTPRSPATTVAISPQPQLSSSSAATPSAAPPALLVCTKCHDARRAPPASLNPDRKRTGELLYDTLASPSHPTLSPLVASGKLQILPVKCLANCDAANCIALSSLDKFSYQFTGLCATDDLDIEDIATFAGYYATGRHCAGEQDATVEDQVALTKVKTRPRGLKSNCVARIPPLLGPGRDLLLGSAPRLPPAPIEESEREMGKEGEGIKGEPEVAISLEVEVKVEVASAHMDAAACLPPTPPNSLLLSPNGVVHHHHHHARVTSTSPCGPLASGNASSDDGFRLVRSRRRRRARTPSRKLPATSGGTAMAAW